MHRLLLIFALLFSVSASAQTDMQMLQKWLNGVAHYDNEYPREKVYLHTDQKAYVHGETMWIKGLVVRASSLLPKPVSRVLYVELFNVEGNLVERQLLRIDDNGQAEGHIDLVDPIFNGFYELRAYTREMVNWGQSAIYTQVVPVFDEELGIDLPEFPKVKSEPSTESSSALTAEKADDGYILTAGMGIENAQLCALLVTHRERPCYVDTLTVGGAAGLVQIELDNSTLRDGWNCCYLMNTQGSSLGQIYVWKEATVQCEYTVNIFQNKGSYGPFDPVAVEVQVLDAKGKPVPDAQFSMAVCDREGYFLENRSPDLTAHLLSDQGGRDMPLAVMTGAEPFRLTQPIEDKLLLRGQLFNDNNKQVPMPHFNLNVLMYTKEGGALSGEVRTDSVGKFAFVSNEDFVGDWIAQFSVRNDDGKRNWSRVALDRHFDIKRRTWTPEDIQFTRATKLRDAQVPSEPRIFQWEDTIPRVAKSIALAEAKVTGKGKYSGFKGDRYSYRGGERRGMHFAEKYINVVQALEQWKDQGGTNDMFQYFLQDYDPDFKYYPISYAPPYDKIPLEEQLDGLNFFYKGQRAYVFIDNKLVTIDHDLYRDKKTGERLKVIKDGGVMRMREEIGEEMSILQTKYWVSEIKSVVVMTDRENWWCFLSGTEQEYIMALPQNHTAIFIYTRPEHYRYRGKKGVDMRVIQGFQMPTPYPAPKYNGIEPENPDDFRRTLYWAPTLTTNKEGKASVVFFNGARPDTELSFSLRGITPDGHIINVER